MRNPELQDKPEAATASKRKGVEVVQGAPICPYCGDSFPTFPKRKRKCPRCQNVIVIWRGRKRTERTLVTEARAALLEAEEEAERLRILAEIEQDPERRFRRVARMVDGLQISDAEIRQQLAAPSMSEHDAAWGLFNQNVTRCMAENNFRLMSLTYFKMALQLYNEGREFRRLLVEANRMKLKEIRQWSLESPGLVSGVLIYSDGCDSCSELDGRRYSLEEAIRSQPLPHPECTVELKAGRPGWCTCAYSFYT